MHCCSTVVQHVLVHHHGSHRFTSDGRRFPANFPVDFIAAPEMKMNTWMVKLGSAKSMET